MRYATHFMVSFLRFFEQQRKMLGFPTHVVGTPTIRGKAQRYKGSFPTHRRDPHNSGESPALQGQLQRKMLGFPTHIVGTPGKNNRDAEGAPHNSGESPALQGQLQRKMPG